MLTEGDRASSKTRRPGDRISLQTSKTFVALVGIVVSLACCGGILMGGLLMRSKNQRTGIGGARAAGSSAGGMPRNVPDGPKTEVDPGPLTPRSALCNAGGVQSAVPSTVSPPTSQRNSLGVSWVDTTTANSEPPSLGDKDWPSARTDCTPRRGSGEGGSGLPSPHQREEEIQTGGCTPRGTPLTRMMENVADQKQGVSPRVRQRAEERPLSARRIAARKAQKEAAQEAEDAAERERIENSTECRECSHVLVEESAFCKMCGCKCEAKAVIRVRKEKKRQDSLLQSSLLLMGLPVERLQAVLLLGWASFVKAELRRRARQKQTEQHLRRQHQEAGIRFILARLGVEADKLPLLVLKSWQIFVRMQIAQHVRKCPCGSILSAEAVFCFRCGRRWPRVRAEFLVDNTQLRSLHKGFSYRFSKAPMDVDKDREAVFGTIVRGVDEGDGWLRVGDRYLPMEVRGRVVLRPVRKGDGDAVVSEDADRRLLVSSRIASSNVVAEALCGIYVCFDTNHGKPAYQKEVFGESDIRIFLYYWDESDGEEFSGWWFGDEVGGIQVFARIRAHTPQPPHAGWRIPWDAPFAEDGGLLVSLQSRSPVVAPLPIVSHLTDDAAKASCDSGNHNKETATQASVALDEGNTHGGAEDKNTKDTKHVEASEEEQPVEAEANELEMSRGTEDNGEVEEKRAKQEEDDMPAVEIKAVGSETTQKDTIVGEMTGENGKHHNGEYGLREMQKATSGNGQRRRASESSLTFNLESKVDNGKSKEYNVRVTSPPNEGSTRRPSNLTPRSTEEEAGKSPRWFLVGRPHRNSGDSIATMSP
eukprot:TRINITY_DN61029_c0_g1_i1.p1 TRINITY_DN61029_c0_g1~~TRINITY_DN61029_c0_g1_i1.p1  ORF type:complete len:954 (-),score=171.61 TRINITY_DN61029_c0_g1_i1:68-2518(-)